jgi:putative transposase
LASRFFFVNLLEVEPQDRKCYYLIMTRRINIAPLEYYHNYNRGNDKREIFHDKDDYDRFVKLLYLMNSSLHFNINDIKRTGKWENCNEIDRGETLVDIGAWCLMPNHFHLLIREREVKIRIKKILLEVQPQEKQQESLTDERIVSGTAIFMQKLQTAYSMYYNKKYHRNGSLMEGRFKSRHLDYDEYLKYMFAYVHLNPIALIESGWKKKQILNKEGCIKFLY